MSQISDRKIAQRVRDVAGPDVSTDLSDREIAERVRAVAEGRSIGNYPRQLAITEKSNPVHIQKWIESGSREIVVVMTSVIDDLVLGLVALAREAGLQVVGHTADIQARLVV